MIKHQYKTATITKRSGMDRIRRSVSGYRVWISGQESRNFGTLTEAKAYVDSKVGA